MKIHIPKFFRLAVLGATGFGLVQSLMAANLMNGGFATATSNQAAYWSSTATPPGVGGGTIRGGVNGGDGWTTSYFGGSYPTDSSFAATVAGPVRQDLSGAGNTFVEGVTYTTTMDIFSSSSWGSALNAKIMWSLAFTAAGTAVSSDHWFSDEFTAQSVANGGNIPNDHIVSIVTGSTGLRTVTLSYTATAADAGKVIGVRLGGDTQTKYALIGTPPVPDDRYGMMDNVTFSSNAANLVSFTSDLQALDGNGGFYLSWSIQNPAQITTLTLDSGSGPVDVKPATDPETGSGEFFVNPTAATTYTLSLNGSQQSQVTVQAGKALSLTRGARVALAPSYEVTLNWSVQPIGASVSLSNGVSSIDVTADTDPETGLGSKSVVVPNPSTIFTLSVNGSPLVATTRVLREASNTAAFSISSASVENGQQITVTWTGAAGGATDWVGIYTAGTTPGGNGEYSVAWNYLNGTRTAGAGPADGSMTFTLPVGNYYAVLLLNDAYVMAQGPLMFSVVNPPPVEEPIKVTSITKQANGVTLVWESKAGVAYSIYGSNDLQGDPLVDWDEVGIALPSDGDDTTDFTETFESGAPTCRFYRIYEVPAAP